MAASNLVNFKRGSQSALNSLKAQKKGVDGCFYLTLDIASTSTSSRLYIGRADGDIVPVNQGIITVATVNDLNSNVNNGNIQTGDFAYVTSGNILAVYSGNK